MMHDDKILLRTLQEECFDCIYQTNRKAHAASQHATKWAFTTVMGTCICGENRKRHRRHLFKSQVVAWWREAQEKLIHAAQQQGKTVEKKEPRIVLTTADFWSKESCKCSFQRVQDTWGSRAATQWSKKQQRSLTWANTGRSRIHNEDSGHKISKLPTQNWETSSSSCKLDV